MALVFADRVLETSTTTGTGALTLAGAVSGFKAFSSALTSPSDTCYYAIFAVDTNGNPSGDWETGIGTYSGANTLTRTTVIASSNSNAAVSFAAGTKRVGIVPVAAGPPFSWVDSTGNFLAPLTQVGDATNGYTYVRTTNGFPEVHVRPMSGKKGVTSYSENGVADRWSVGIKPTDSNIYWSAGDSVLGNVKMTLSSGGNLILVGTITATNIGTAAAVNLTVGTTAPSSPSAGDLWVDTS